MDLSSEADGGASRLATYVQALSAALEHADRVAPFCSYRTGLLLSGERKTRVAGPRLWQVEAIGNRQAGVVVGE